MKKLLLIAIMAIVVSVANSQIIVKETCHNSQYGITSDSVYIEIVINGKIDIRVSDTAHINEYANAYMNISNYYHNYQPLLFNELPNLYQYQSNETDYYIRYKNKLLQLNPSWNPENIIILQ